MITRKCTQCGKDFTITDGEIEFFNSKGFDLPTHCKECRSKKKNANNFVNKPYTDSHSGNLDQLQHQSYLCRKAKRKVASYLLIPIIIIAIIFAILSQIDFNNDNSQAQQSTSTSYTFRSDSLLSEHFSKHGGETGSQTKQEYLTKANAVISSGNAQYKNEQEDNDSIYFIASTGEIVFMSTDGYIRTYFIADQAYFNKQIIYPFKEINL